MDNEEKKEDIIPEAPVSVQEGEQKELPPEEMGFWQAVAGVFMEPSKAFPFLASKKSWVVLPLLLLTLSTFFSSYMFVSKVDKDAAFTQQLRTNKFLSRLDQSQIEQMRKRTIEGSNIARPITSSIAVLLLVAFASLVYYLCFLALGGNINYGKTLFVVSWAKLTTVLANILSMIIIVFKSPDALVGSDPFGSMEPKTVLLSNLANIIGAEKLPSALFALLASLDVFIIWYLALLILGFSSVARVSKAISSTVVLSIYALLVVFGVAMVFFFLQ